MTQIAMPAFQSARLCHNTDLLGVCPRNHSSAYMLWPASGRTTTGSESKQANSEYSDTLLGLVFCDQSAVEMWIGTRLAGAKFTLLSRSGPTSRTSNSEHLLWAEFFCHTNLPLCTVYALLTTDMGRFSRKALISALFICKPPL